MFFGRFRPVLGLESQFVIWKPPLCPKTLIWDHLAKIGQILLSTFLLGRYLEKIFWNKVKWITQTCTKQVWMLLAESFSIWPLSRRSLFIFWEIIFMCFLWGSYPGLILDHFCYIISNRDIRVVINVVVYITHISSFCHNSCCKRSFFYNSKYSSTYHVKPDTR